MGKAYSEEQRIWVKSLLEAGRDEDAIEKETGVSDRTIRRWKLELERTGRIGKPADARTGRNRALTKEMENDLCDHVNNNPGLSVDDMVWWLYEKHQIVVGTRTIRRVFERRGIKSKATKGKTAAQDDSNDDNTSDIDPTTDEQTLLVSPQLHTVAAPAPYQSPYAPMAQQTEQHLAQVLQQQQQQQNTQPPTFPAMPGNTKANEEEDDEETIQLELQQIALERREIELKLKMRRLKQSKSATSITKKAVTAGPQSTPSTLYNPNAASTPQQPKRDSRSKKKIEESKRRTAERQERMLKDLERRSRRREHLTAEWVQSKDIWPLRAQSLLANLMHQYICYAFSQNNIETFEAIYRELYQLVDLGKGDWVPHVHDDMLRERMKRKMGQLRNKMQKTGEIVVRGDAYSGWQKAADYTGEAAGQGIGDETEMPDSMPAQPDDQNIPDDKFTYDAVAEHQALQHPNMAYGAPLMQHPGAPQYPMMPQQHHPSMMPYGQMDGSHQESMVM